MDASRSVTNCENYQRLAACIFLKLSKTEYNRLVKFQELWDRPQ